MRWTSSLIITIILLWLASGPTFEGLTMYTAFAFFCGILAGIFWGISALMWILGLKNERH